MNISSILVVVPRDVLDEAVAQLNALPGVEVHHWDASSGRIVVTQEAVSVNEEIAGLQRIKALPGVTMAEMVYHYFGDEAATIAEKSSSESAAGLTPEDRSALLNE